LFTHAANACESSEQSLPPASEEVRSRCSTMWLEVPQSLMALSLACGNYNIISYHII